MDKINIKYIFTEISLVTIGILVAIAIDNWNSERLLKTEINNYLIEVQYEIENTGIKYQRNKIKSFESMTGKLILSGFRHDNSCHQIRECHVLKRVSHPAFRAPSYRTSAFDNYKCSYDTFSDESSRVG